MGDDWFHNGAFREQNLPYIYNQGGDSRWLGYVVVQRFR